VYSNLTFIFSFREKSSIDLHHGLPLGRHLGDLHNVMYASSDQEIYKLVRYLISRVGLCKTCY